MFAYALQHPSLERLTTCSPRETRAANVFLEFEKRRRIEQVLVADHEHTFHMIVVLILLRALTEHGDRSRHLQKTISYKLESLIIFTHASLQMNLLTSVFFGVIRVFGQSFKS